MQQISRQRRKQQLVGTLKLGKATDDRLLQIHDNHARFKSETKVAFKPPTNFVKRNLITFESRIRETMDHGSMRSEKKRVSVQSIDYGPKNLPHKQENYKPFYSYDDPTVKLEHETSYRTDYASKPARTLKSPKKKSRKPKQRKSSIAPKVNESIPMKKSTTHKAEYPSFTDKAAADGRGKLIPPADYISRTFLGRKFSGQTVTNTSFQCSKQGERFPVKIAQNNLVPEGDFRGKSVHATDYRPEIPDLWTFMKTRKCPWIKDHLDKVRKPLPPVDKTDCRVRNIQYRKQVEVAAPIVSQTTQAIDFHPHKVEPRLKDLPWTPERTYQAPWGESVSTSLYKRDFLWPPKKQLQVKDQRKNLILVKKPMQTTTTHKTDFPPYPYQPKSKERIKSPNRQIDAPDFMVLAKIKERQELNSTEDEDVLRKSKLKTPMNA